MNERSYLRGENRHRKVSQSSTYNHRLRTLADIRREEERTHAEPGFPTFLYASSHPVHCPSPTEIVFDHWFEDERKAPVPAFYWPSLKPDAHNQPWGWGRSRKCIQSLPPYHRHPLRQGLRIDSQTSCKQGSEQRASNSMTGGGKTCTCSQPFPHASFQGKPSIPSLHSLRLTSFGFPMHLFES